FTNGCPRAEEPAHQRGNRLCYPAVPLQTAEQDSDLRAATAPLRVSNALPFQLGHDSVLAGRRGRRGWTRTSSLLFVRQALCPIELLAGELRDKDSNLDLHGQRVTSSPF